VNPQTQLLWQLMMSGLGNSMSGRQLVVANGDLGILRPWMDPRGQTWCTMRYPGWPKGPDGKILTYNQPVHNTPSLVTREDWFQIDQDIRWQVKQPLVFWSRLMATVRRDVPNALGKLVLPYRFADGEADAILSMDPARRSERTKAQQDMDWIPLPVWHSDGEFTMRESLVSANSAIPLDTTGLRLGARKIAEKIEDFALGVSDPFSYAAGTIYGAMNYPYRNTFTMTSPEAGGWTPVTLVNELNRIFKILHLLNYDGPYEVFYSSAWQPWLDGDYSSTEPSTGTVLERLRKMSKIKSFTEVQRLPGFRMLVMQLTEDVVQAVNGMDFTTVQWKEHGGMAEVYKIMAMQYPFFHHDYSGHTGYVDASAADPTTTTTSTTTTTTTTTP